MTDRPPTAEELQAQIAQSDAFLERVVQGEAAARERATRLRQHYEQLRANGGEDAVRRYHRSLEREALRKAAEERRSLLEQLQASAAERQIDDVHRQLQSAFSNAASGESLLRSLLVAGLSPAAAGAAAARLAAVGGLANQLGGAPVGTQGITHHATGRPGAQDDDTPGHGAAQPRGGLRSLLSSAIGSIPVAIERHHERRQSLRRFPEVDEHSSSASSSFSAPKGG